MRNFSVLLLFSMSFALACRVSSGQFNTTSQGGDAAFTVFNGRNEIVLPVRRDERFFVRFKIGLQKGSLRFLLRSSSGVALDSTIRTDWADSIALDNPTHADFKVVLWGKDAAGHYTIESGAAAGR